MSIFSMSQEMHKAHRFHRNFENQGECTLTPVIPAWGGEDQGLKVIISYLGSLKPSGVT